MGYTVLTATPDGVVLGAYHARRFHGSPAEAEAWRQVSARLDPGVWAVGIAASGDVRVEPRGSSRLREGMPVRYAVSPVASGRGVIAKPEPPCVYDGVRTPGTATLLTSGDGAEVFEACAAAVVAWDGERLVCVPADRPRVWSTAEAAIREHLAPRQVPILVRDGWPLLLVNAVKGCCGVATRPSLAFPGRARQQIEALFAELTRQGD